MKNNLRWIADKIEHWPIERLVPYIRNPRTHSAEQITKIAASISEFGFTNPILVGSDRVIVAGHGRFEAAKKIGMQTVPVIVIDHLTPTQRRALSLADNRLSEISEWDNIALTEEIESLLNEGFDMECIGFSDADIDRIIGDLSASDDKDDSVKDANVAKADIENDTGTGTDQRPAENKTFYPLLFYMSKRGFDRWTEWKKTIREEDNAKALEILLERVL